MSHGHSFDTNCFHLDHKTKILFGKLKMLNEKKIAEVVIPTPPSRSPSIEEGNFVDPSEEREVFKKNVNGVEFRTVSWQRATIIFVKYTVATGILGIPSALNTLGAVGGGINIVGWGAMNACETRATWLRLTFY